MMGNSQSYSKRKWLCIITVHLDWLLSVVILLSTNSAQLLRKTLSFPSLITLMLGLINYISSSTRLTDPM